MKSAGYAALSQPVCTNRVWAPPIHTMVCAPYFERVCYVPSHHSPLSPSTARDIMCAYIMFRKYAFELVHV